jgi:hypothetical protein
MKRSTGDGYFLPFAIGIPTSYPKVRRATRFDEISLNTRRVVARAYNNANCCLRVMCEASGY